MITFVFPMQVPVSLTLLFSANPRMHDLDVSQVHLGRSAGRRTFFNVMERGKEKGG